KIEDWCISRQLWWGHRIPAWYDDAGNVYVGESEADVRKTHQLDEHEVVLTQDEDVLDTWFSSALWPFSSLGWPTHPEQVNRFYPTSVLVTGFDIIFFWVARMMMMSLHIMNEVPFKTIYVHGLIQDAEGEKMSKSKGNVIDTLDLIDGISRDDLLEKRTQGLMQPHLKDKITKLTLAQFPEGIDAYGTDALRFTLCALATHGRHIRFDLNRLAGYRNFCNKLWNATRFVLMGVPEHVSEMPLSELTVYDQAILSELEQLKTVTQQHLAEFRFDLLAQSVYEFTWNRYCDVYLEYAKVLRQNPAYQAGVSYTLITVLETLLRIMHPIIPFITEELWQEVAPRLGIQSDMLATMPQHLLMPERRNTIAEKSVSEFEQILLAIRQLRAELNLSPAKSITLMVQTSTADEEALLKQHAPMLQAILKITDMTWPDKDSPQPASVSAVVAGMRFSIPLAGLLDVVAEHQRLTTAINKLIALCDRASTKLGNPGYVDKAPAAVVEQERDRLKQWTEELNQLTEQRAKLADLE
ncbi:MAG: class I tRNA ligase family protein, partial [Pseudomonadota bacterium]